MNDKEIESKVEEWSDVAFKLKQAKELEMKLRKEICAHIFEGKEGKFKKDFEIGEYELQANSNTTLKIDEGIFGATYPDMAEEEKNCIKYKPSLIAGKFNKLESEGLLHMCIEEVPAAPTLKIIS